MKLFDTLYKIDVRGETRVWYMEQDGSKHRTTAGIAGGSLVTSEWTQCYATNVGRSNERGAEAQALFEICAQYDNKLAREYHTTIESAKTGAHFYKPMLAHKFEQFVPGFAQPKLDGIRCIAKADGLWSRQGKPIFGAPHILAALKPMFREDKSLVLDGELYNHDYKDNFNAIVSAVKKQRPSSADLVVSGEVVQYHVYDLPSAKKSFSQRTKLLKALVKLIKKPIIYVPTHAVSEAGDYDELHGRWIEEGYEGSIWRADGMYEHRRSNNLRKRKEFVDAEFELVRIEEGLGNWSGVAKRAICRLPDGREFGAGIKGTKDRAAELLHETHKVVTVKYFALTPDGIPRFPIAIKFHGEERLL